MQGRLVFIICVFLVTILGVKPGSPIQAAESPFHEILHRAFSFPITTVASSKQAVQFFSKHLAGPLGFHTPRLRGQTDNTAKALTQPAIRFIAQISAYHHLSALLETYTAEDWEAFLLLAKQHPKHVTWVTDILSPSTVSISANFADTLSHLMAITPHQGHESSHYSLFTETINQTYPNWQRSEDSWMNLIQREGYRGVQNRLTHTWNTLQATDSPKLKTTKSSEQATEDIERYLTFQFLPLFKAHLLAHLTTLHHEIWEQTFGTWNLLTRFAQERSERQGLLRLCGTWQWTVHNHQNHQDHKMTIEFPQPDSLHTMNPPPSTLIVRGDTIYMRWDFPKGFQENSLLFSGQDKRMEGTFYNSMGPNGNITGRRIAPCKKQ